PYLQTNKLGLAAYKDELQEAVYESVKSVWDSTKALSDEARLDFVNAKLSRTMAKILKFTPKGDTHTKIDEAEIGADGQRKPDKTSPKPGPNTEPTAKPGGSEGGARPKKPKASGIKFRKLDEMDDNYAINVVADSSGLEARLNGKIEAIAHAYERPVKVAAIWPVISFGSAAYLV